MKARVEHTIERALLERLDGYLADRQKVTGGSKSRSSVIEESLEWYLPTLERQLSTLKLRDAAIIVS